MIEESEPERIGLARPHASGGAAVWVIGLLVLLPLGYALSIGPVVAVVEKTGVGQEAVEVFYAPVIWLHEYTFLKQPLEWYAELWGWH